MRYSFRAAAIGLIVCCATLYAGLLPILQLDSPTVKAFNDYVSTFDNSVMSQFSETGKLWIDDDSRKGAFDAGKPVVEPRENQDVQNGSIHHYTGTLRIEGATIAQVRRVMQDYPDYPKYFRPDVGTGSGEVLPDSTPQDEHFHGKLLLTQTTLWIDVVFNSLYDTHYRWIGKDRWLSRSSAISLREAIDPKNLSSGYYPEGKDHGFLWKTNTYWFARQRNGGLELEADSISLSRPNVPGFAWWGSKRSHDAVEKMLKDVKAAIENSHCCAS